MKANVLSALAVQLEASFGGAGTGTIFSMCGLTEFDQRFEPVARSTRINVWRLEESQQSAGASYRGRIDIELKVGGALNLLVKTMMPLDSQSDVGGGTQYNYRLRRADDVSSSVKLLGSFEDGPWFTLSGVVLTALRLTVRAQQVVRMSLDWLAASKTETAIDPEWEIVDQTIGSGGGVFGEDGPIFGEGGGLDFGVSGILPISAAAGVLSIDESAVDSFVELTVEIEGQREAMNLGRAGSASRLVRNGPTIVGGNLVEYFIGEDLPAKVRSGEEFALECVLSDGLNDRLSVTLPRAVGQSGQPSIRGDTDVVSAVTFKVLNDAAATEAEPILTLVVI